MRPIARSAASVLAGALILLPLLGCQSHPASPSRPGMTASILIDSIHAHNALHLSPDDDPYTYHNTYAFRRAFDYLRSRQVPMTEANTGRLTPELLSKNSVLFINLVSADLPAYTVSEILAIKSFIQAGGGLLLITDHTNCYYHLTKLEPLLGELDIHLSPVTACEYPPHTLGWKPGGWIAIDQFSPHPLTQDLHTIAFQTGGTVDDRFAIASTSARAWADAAIMHPYGEGDTPAFFGNFQPDPGEQIGKLPVLLAKNFGKGRIVIIPDQNCLSDPFLNYADNYRLFLNAVSWLSNDASLRETGPYIAWNRNRIACFEQFNDHAVFGDSNPNGYYGAYVNLARRFPCFAVNDLAGDWPVIVFAHSGYTLSPQQLDAVVQHLRNKKSIVILRPDSAQIAAGKGMMGQLSAEFGPPNTRPEKGMLISQWPDAGRAILLTDQDIRTLPAFDSKPDPLQQSRVDNLLSAIQLALTGAEKP